MRVPMIKSALSFRKRAGLRVLTTTLGIAAIATAHATVIFPRLTFLQSPWGTYSGDPQHTGVSHYASSSLDQIIWSDDIDAQQPANAEIFAHYGSPTITTANTVIYPVTLIKDTTYRFKAVNGATGVEIWHFDTDYVHGYQGWTTPVEGSVTLRNSYVMPGLGGSVYFRQNADSASSTTTQLYFYGAANHAANAAWCDANIKISTPIMADGRGNMWFGYYVGDSFNQNATVTIPGGFPDVGRGGIVRMNTAGTAVFVKATTAAGDSTMRFVANACAPALSNDAGSIYMAVNSSISNSPGYLLKLNATTLTTQAKVMPTEPQDGNASGIQGSSSGCPMVGPDGDVYFGTFGRNGWTDYRESHGWMQHYNANLVPKGAVGAFGWDDTATLVPASCVPGYSGTSSYLLLTKYNNYGWADFWNPGDPGIDYGADAQNMVAILDPNDNTGTDRQSGHACMKPVMVVFGDKADVAMQAAGVTGALREWCINSAAIDPTNKCAIVNSEDGYCYRWDFTTNSLLPVNAGVRGIFLNGPIGEAYTPTVIGPDGTVYAINNHHIYAISHF